MDLLTDHLAEARIAHRRGDWHASHAAFTRADGVGPLALDDVDAFATAAWRLGHAGEAVRLAERVYDRLVRTDPAAASMAAVDLALRWLTRGDPNICRIWQERSRRLIAGAAVGPVDGYLGYLDAVLAVRGGDTGALSATAASLDRVVASLHDPALLPMSSIVHALVAFSDHRVDDGHALVERALPVVESGELRIEWAGDVYGVLLHDCQPLADPSRTVTWVDSMGRWCGAHDVGLYHRVLHVHQATSERELLTESAALVGVHGRAAATGFHRLGEMRRLRGDADGAAAAFAEGRRLGVG